MAAAAVDACDFGLAGRCDSRRHRIAADTWRHCGFVHRWDCGFGRRLMAHSAVVVAAPSSGWRLLGPSASVCSWDASNSWPAAAPAPADGCCASSDADNGPWLDGRCPDAPAVVLCRYRLVIFSKNHSIPMSCTVC